MPYRFVIAGLDPVNSLLLKQAPCSRQVTCQRELLQLFPNSRIVIVFGWRGIMLVIRFGKSAVCAPRPAPGFGSVLAPRRLSSLAELRPLAWNLC